MELRYGQRCQWAEPTLFLAHPFWIAAEEYPWSCRVDSVPRPIEDTTACRACDRWLPVKPRVRLLRNREQV
ncbi:MAG TPA: hypothetical protein VEL51_07020 [Vicinamibacterales bacterium]|nr:hypothetical protein [Vicinamibacterales bacterium]